MWFFSGLCITVIIHVIPVVMTQLQPKIAFQLSTSNLYENAANSNLIVNLSTESKQAIAVDYAVTGGTASNNHWGSGQDYVLTEGTLTFDPGIISKKIPFSIIDDGINEADETIQIKLANPKNAILGKNKLHTVTVTDNDRKSIVNVVKNFGATGNGITDDTKAIQKAVNTVYKAGGGVIIFPPGTYLVTSVDIKENITYYGYGATITRPKKQDKWTRTFKAKYAKSFNSAPLIIQGLTFDGNFQNQGAYKDYQLEQAHLVFLHGDANLPGKLQAFIEDCTFKNAVADGISAYTNVDVKVANIKAINVFRGGFVLTGGNSSAEVYNLTTRGKINPTGIDIEVDGKGYGDTLKVDVKLEKLHLLDGDFDIAVSEGSKVFGNNIISDDGPFYIYSEDSTMKFTNSRFKVGAADGFMNRILFPHHVTFENCQFYITRKETGKPYQYFAVADVWWQHPNRKTHRHQKLVFRKCHFQVDSNIKKTDTTYAIYLRKDSPANNNQLILDGVNISPNFDADVIKK
ncbi:MAG: glycosyl hydrolase family 28-related protein [Calothrix sp. MO_167.B12]|nr:glycosyl hydrolase family 28-related protein [Calothrix sp. MO_167.B12]